MPNDLSVIVPAYNKAGPLRLNLASLANQTLEHARFEILVIDDGSTDHTKRIVDEARALYDLQIRYWYLNRPDYGTAALPWNFGAKRAQAEIIVQAGADMLLARDALALLLEYVADSDGATQVFGHAYSVHSPLSQAMLDHVHWQTDIHVLETLLITAYHHASYWRVPLLAALPKVWFERLRGYDESYEGRWPDDADFWVRLEASGVKGMNPPDVWAAHQFHVQVDPPCGEGCECPLYQKGKTWPGPEMRYQGTPEDLVRNQASWGEYADSYEG